MTRSPNAHMLLGVVGAVVTTALPRLAAAEALPTPSATETKATADTPVDVVMRDAPPPRRRFSVEWNPLSLIVGKLSANVLFVPTDHHALVVAPFFAWTTTYAIDIYDDNGNQTQLPTQKFMGGGAEIGYRYYTGLGGPRGFFAGPSLILAGMNVNAQNGTNTHYVDLGLAADVGYELLVVDSVALTVGAGVQYATPTTSIPNQQFPADVYASGRVFPRAVASIGWAF